MDSRRGPCRPLQARLCVALKPLRDICPATARGGMTLAGKNAASLGHMCVAAHGSPCFVSLFLRWLQLCSSPRCTPPPNPPKLLHQVLSPTIFAFQAFTNHPQIQLFCRHPRIASCSPIRCRIASDKQARRCCRIAGDKQACRCCRCRRRRRRSTQVRRNSRGNPPFSPRNFSCQHTVERLRSCRPLFCHPVVHTCRPKHFTHFAPQLAAGSTEFRLQLQIRGNLAGFDCNVRSPPADDLASHDYSQSAPEPCLRHLLEPCVCWCNAFQFGNFSGNFLRAFTTCILIAFLPAG